MHWLARYALILAGVVIAGVGAGMARPAITFYVRYTLGAALLSATVLTSSFMLGRTIGSLLAGAAGARASGLRWAVASGALLGASLVVHSVTLAHTPVEVHLFMAAWGLMAGLAWPTVQIGVADVRPEASNTLLSIYFAVGTLGISAGNKIFGNPELGYEALIRTGSLLILASAPLFAVALWRLPRSRSRKALGRRGGGDRSAFAWILMVAFAIGFLVGMLRDYFYLYAAEVVGLSREELGNLLAVSGVLGMAGSIIAGVAADRVGAWKTLPVLAGMAAAGALMVSLPELAVPGFLLATLGTRASLPQTRNAALLPGGAGAALVGLSNSLSSVGMMTGPIVAGLVSGEKASGSPYLAAEVLLTAILAAYVLVARRGEEVSG